jgi:hypothetical protein
MSKAKKTIQWNAGNPPRRGIYKVRSDGPSHNVGYRYWDGARWGMLCSTHAMAKSIQMSARRSRLTKPVLWASWADPDQQQRDPELMLLEQQLQMAKDLATERLQMLKDERERAARFKSCLQWVIDNPRAHPANRNQVIKAALGQ